jgi:hypothetical protein
MGCRCPNKKSKLRYRKYLICSLRIGPFCSPVIRQTQSNITQSGWDFTVYLDSEIRSELTHRGAVLLLGGRVRTCQRSEFTASSRGMKELLPGPIDPACNGGLWQTPNLPSERSSWRRFAESRKFGAAFDLDEERKKYGWCRL